ncbi:MAG: DUF502 domain-containing protein [Chitinophagaceae bacterium]|nr:DUF502 domain-containing protein [Chitinophagaceae bacterium]
MKKNFNYKKLPQYLLQGLLILGPVTITMYFIYWAFSSIDNLLPIFTYTDARGFEQVRNYGIGFAIIIGVLILIGYISSFFITSRFLSVFDKILEKTPGIKHIYSTTRDFFEAFAGENKKFTKHVLANIDDNDVWRFGFITHDDMHDFGLNDYVTVYVPMAYSISGNVYVIPKKRIRPIENISAAETMKFAVSGGVTDIDEDESKK